MKLGVVLYSTLWYVQVFASFYGQIRGAMSNVERGFGKLISDVVFDVKDTLHCTISAVEQVLAMNGLIDVSSDYNNRCRFARPKIIPKERDDAKGSFFDRRFKYAEPRLTPQSELEHISQELESSILNVNKSINDILRRREANGDFKVISESLKDETNRLNAVTELMERELENISMNVRNEILKLRIGRKKPPRDTIWEDLKALHDLKGKSNNKTEQNEITNIIDKVESELHRTPSEKVLSEQEKLGDIKKQLNIYTNGKQNDQISLLNTEGMVQNEIRTQKEIKSFKDLAQNIMKNDDKLIAGSNIGQVFKREATPEASTREKALFGENLASMDRSSPFYNPNPIADSHKIVEDAKSIMEESRKSEELLNNFFKEHQNSNTDIFSNSGMFNFG